MSYLRAGILSYHLFIFFFLILSTYNPSSENLREESKTREERRKREREGRKRERKEQRKGGSKGWGESHFDALIRINVFGQLTSY